jgi:hypothetical protein
MTIWNIGLFTVLLIATTIALRVAYTNYRRNKLNKKITEKLDGLIYNILDSVKEAQGLAGHGMPEDFPPDITSPEMLATLVTVIVNKHGTLHLTLSDFTDLPVDEFVSIYVDTDSKELILSLDDQLSELGPHTMVSFNTSDDNTFH